MNILDFFNKNKIPSPPWDYGYLLRLAENEYPEYLKVLFKTNTGKNLNLNNPKSFNEKMQWLKLNDVSQLKRDCTDKLLVRNYVNEKIGREYVKPLFQICNSFDEIDLYHLPEWFVMKCSHGEDWQYVIKDKVQYLSNPILIKATRKKMLEWMNQEYWAFNGFEMQYRGLNHKILIEPLLREEKDKEPRTIEIYCFNGEPKIFVNIKYAVKREVSYYDENFNYGELIFHPENETLIVGENADSILKKSVELSRELSKDFKFVRVDWIVYYDKLFLDKLTFTPYSGFMKIDKKWDKKLGSFIDLRREPK